MRLVLNCMTLLLLMSFFGQARSTGIEVHVALNSYQVPPYHLPNDMGLSSSLVNALNRHLVGHRLVLQNVPRARLQRYSFTDKNFSDTVLFVTPSFVGDPAMTRFQWTEPLFSECNLFVSNVSSSVPLNRENIQGKKFAGVFGYRYEFIDSLVSVQKLRREDSQDEASGMQKVALGRADFSVVPTAIFNYFRLNSEWAKRLSVAPVPLNCFSRHILVAKSQPALLKALNRAIPHLRDDRVWIKALAAVRVEQVPSAAAENGSPRAR